MSARHGYLVRTTCGATGRALGVDNLAIYICCSDNDVSLCEIAEDREPQLGLPQVTDDEINTAAMAYREGKRRASTDFPATPPVGPATPPVQETKEHPA